MEPTGDYPGGPNGITRVLAVNERSRRVRARQCGEDVAPVSGSEGAERGQESEHTGGL